MTNIFLRVLYDTSPQNLKFGTETYNFNNYLFLRNKMRKSINNKH